MLVLTRKVGESIVIGDDIEITLVRIEADQVRVGISAPKNVPVYRKELIEEVGRENIRAAETARRESQTLGKLPKPEPRPGSEKENMEEEKGRKG